VIRKNPVIAGRDYILAGSEPIVIFGLNIGHFVEHFEELVSLYSRRSLLQLARVLRYPRMLALHGLSEERIYD
jgi:hypothetical protein